MKIKADLEICKKCPHYQEGIPTKYEMDTRPKTSVKGLTAVCQLRTSSSSPIMWKDTPLAYALCKTDPVYFYNRYFKVPKKCPYRLEFIVK